jgi:peptidyl-prolyl cis-trans isomerase SurA
MLGALLVVIPTASLRGQEGVRTAAVASATPPPEPPIHGKVVEDIVAWVNDQVITQSDYDRALQQLEAEGRQQAIPPELMQERKDNLLRDLIDQQLLLSKGKELGITGETELIHQLDEIRKQNHLKTMEDLEKAAQEQGVSYEDFKQNIRNGIITQQVVRDQVHVALTRADAEAYFKAHESEFAQPETIKLKEILIKPASNPATGVSDQAQLQTAMNKANEIEADLKAGQNFDDLAKKYSEGPNAAEGGDLGDFHRGMMAKELDDQTFSLNAGQCTKPIRTKQGYIILQVAEHTPGGDASFKQVEPKVEEALYMERMQPALRQYLTKLREDGYVDLRPGAVDTGASPNEVHAVTSAYTPPQPKKKKKKFARKRYRGRDRSRRSQTASSKSASASGHKTTQVAGKKEKIRYGQAPRESLPPALSPTPSTDATTADAGDNSALPVPGGQVAAAVNPDISYVNPDGSTSTAAVAEGKSTKSRFSDRARFHKKKTAAGANMLQPPPPSPEELASQKVQDAPLGLNPTPPPVKKKKAKKVKKVKTPGEEKTRYHGKAPKPAETPQQQPYLGDSAQTPGGTPQPAPQQAPPQNPGPPQPQQ